MKRDTINYALVGAVVLGALAILVVGLALITGRGVATDSYFVHYRSVAGLRFGAPVFYQGYRIGQVGTVTPERGPEGTRYRVELSIRRDWPIPSDSPARLQSSGLLADVSIAIREGESHDTLKVGGELKGEEGGDIFGAVNDLAGQVSELTRTQLTPLIRTLNERVDSITDTIDQNAPIILDQTRALLERMNKAADALNDVLKPDNRAAIASALANASKLSADLRKSRATLDQALADVDGMIRENRPDVRGAVRDLGAVLRALSSRMDVITHHLESASRNLNEFSREIRKHPNRLIIAPKADAIEDEPQ